jgi:hypothetical protein
LGEVLPTGRVFNLGSFLIIREVTQIFAYFFTFFGKKIGWAHFGRFFSLIYVVTFTGADFRPFSRVKIMENFLIHKFGENAFKIKKGHEKCILMDAETISSAWEGMSRI